MRLTIDVATNLVTIDGTTYSIDCSSLTGIATTVEWFDDFGEIIVDGGVTTTIAALSPFQNIIDAWNAVNALPAPPPPPPMAVPSQISRRQLILMLMQLGYMTADEGVAAATVGAVPAFIEAYVITLDTASQALVRITWASMSACVRSDPMLLAIATATGLSSDQVDAAFISASTL